MTKKSASLKSRTVKAVKIDKPVKKGTMNLIPILYVLPVLKLAGAEQVVFDLATRIGKHGFAPTVLCLEDENEIVGKKLLAAGIPVVGLKLWRRRSIACAKAMIHHFPKKRPLLIHAHLFHANLATRLALKRLDPAAQKDIRLLNTVHVAERRFRPWQFTLDRMTAEYASLEICVSQAVKKFQQEKTGLPETFFKVIENGVDMERFFPSEIKKTTQSSVKKKVKHVLSVGRLDAQKDFPTLLRAWKLVQSSEPDATLEICGDGPEAASLKALAASLNLKNVTFAGFVENVPDRMRNATIYVQSSAWEGFGLTVAEAMATALPVIVSNVDSLPELVTDEKTGLIFVQGKHERLAKLMHKLLTDPTRCKELGTAALEEARRRFSVERMVEDHANVYRKMLDGV